MPSDLYAVLELGHDATADEIRAAYRRLAKQFHPDVSAAPDAHQRFIALTEAYEILSVPMKRLRYDMTRHSPSPKRAPERSRSRYEQDVRRYQQEARQRAEQFSSMSYERFDHEYFDTAFGYFAPKMLGCFGIVVVFLVVLIIATTFIVSLDLPIGIIGILMMVLIPLGVWASVQFDTWHNRRQRERKSGIR